MLSRDVNRERTAGESVAKVMTSALSTVLDLIEALRRRSKSMFGAVSLGVFDALVAEPKSLSGRTTSNFGCSELLLDARVGLQLVVRNQER